MSKQFGKELKERNLILSGTSHSQVIVHKNTDLDCDIDRLMATRLTKVNSSKMIFS